MQCTGGVTTLLLKMTAETEAGEFTTKQYIKICSLFASAFINLYEQHKNDRCPQLQQADYEMIPISPMWTCNLTAYPNNTVTVGSSEELVGSCLGDAIKSKCEALQPDSNDTTLLYVCGILGAVLLLLGIHIVWNKGKTEPESERLLARTTGRYLDAIHTLKTDLYKFIFHDSEAPSPPSDNSSRTSSEVELTL